MELREWLIILGLVLVAIIIIDGVRRLKHQRGIPRLDLSRDLDVNDEREEDLREAQTNWELPNGGARYASDGGPVAARRHDAQDEEVPVAEEAGVDEASMHADAFDEDPLGDNVTRHPMVERAMRHAIPADALARDALANADELIVISVFSRDDAGFEGTTLLQLLLACGLRYSPDMHVFHRFETESDDSALQFSMVNSVKPGIFDLEAMDDFATPGVTFLMPLPGADDTAAAFEAMLETAMVIVRNLGGELKDENQSVMTAQTIEFARQRVHEFERRWRLHRQQAT
ncbi:cell division protein ZipA [Larsenimonas rhizosphaerae]|uniref:Cell division protein ZipA n=1 Tax=Larsenimonas rhizosphaerae TaxID=2944682 RepID=A0AA41ZF25_9GAMM|nr:cell division protein ZipA [Larsenimonas rhizosphaerae]MCM2130009.1 cell division protein ZipA [Larsenimonas rhizosphaerae]MCX2522708.1 cell division protein ZipA [Larsenimonas rhizosphaerae]